MSVIVLPKTVLKVSSLNLAIPVYIPFVTPIPIFGIFFTKLVPRSTAVENICFIC